MSTRPDSDQKLIVRMNALIDVLDDHYRDIHVNQRIDKFFYIQKVTELRLLHVQLNEALARVEALQNNMERSYGEAFGAWRKDVRWLNKYKMKKKKFESVEKLP